MEIIGVSVGVQNSNNRNSQLLCFIDRKVLAQRVNHPDGVGSFGESADTAQRLLQLGKFTLLHQKLFLGVSLGGVLVVDFFQLLHAPQTLGDGLEVRQKTTEPALVDIRLTHAGRLLRNCFLSLLFSSHKKNGATGGDGFLQKRIRLIDVAQRLLQIDDVNAAALSEDEPLYLWVPATGLVSKVNTAIK